MDHNQEEFEHKNIRLILAPWQRGFDRIVTPFERFVNHQATSGLLLMFTAMIALFLANSVWGDKYSHLIHMPISFGFGSIVVQKTLHHWINDGLMALFFFVVGLELKREILVGELANLKMAALPVIAAIGGMAMPAIIYSLINFQGEGLRGWGIPMATDIAFALGVIALLAGRVPKALITFLVALAIVDDLGAILIIALFYTEQLFVPALLAAAGITMLMLVLNFVGVRKSTPYFILGCILWIALLKSGVHATLAGVISAFTIPALPRYDPKSFSDRMKELLVRFDNNYKSDSNILKNDDMVSTVQTMRKGLQGVEAPLQHLVYGMHTPVAFIVLPLFAFFNAGIIIDFSNFFENLTQPVVMGVGIGLILGKFIGIAGFSWVALKMGIVTLPPRVSLKHICGAALLASIGFTMSIFIAELAFAHQPEILLQAKLGILSASLLAGTAGYIWLYFTKAQNHLER